MMNLSCLRRPGLSVIALSVALTAACGAEPPAPAPPPAAPPAATATTGHAHEAPHGGTLVELGQEFGHIEVVLDPATGTMTVYVLDGEAEDAVRVAQSTLALKVTGPIPLAARPLVLAARANVLTGETVGDTSQFVLVDEALKGITTLRATLEHISYKGQDFRDVAVSVVVTSSGSF
jgi:hypothetical protein